jgi:molybdopterin-guanine dinucleotide biosynthesis protein A
MILGAVLAGGRSTRFGSDKARALWNGRPLIDHVLDRLAMVASTVIVCGRRLPGATSIADRPASDLGPLGGLNAALHFAAANGFECVISAPCDAPLLDDALLSLLRSAGDNVFLAAMPVIGCWRSDGAAALDHHLRTSNDRSMRRWAALIGGVALGHPAPPNINYPADLDMLGRRPSPAE